MAQQEKKRAIRRLKSVYALRAKVDESYQEGQEAMKAGPPTVWGMLNFYYGDPILKAMGIHSVYPENYGAAAAALGEAGKYLDYADAEGVPTHLCGYSRVNIGYAAMMMKEAGGNIPPGAPMGGIPKPLFLMSSAAICDHRYKWFQSLGRYMDVPVWSFEAPLPGIKELYIGEAYEKAADMGTRHLKDFITFVENISGRKMDWAKLEETVDLMLELNHLWYDTNLLRQAVPCPMHSRDFWTAMPPALFSMGDLKDDLECYKNLKNEIQERVDNGIGAVEEEKFRLLFAELPRGTACGSLTNWPKGAGISSSRVSGITRPSLSTSAG
ncbi:MAG: 2-hydroxyacyl-CoA dehydratase family protein [Pseudomonadota bacterium]